MIELEDLAALAIYMGVCIFSMSATMFAYLRERERYGDISAQRYAKLSSHWSACLNALRRMRLIRSVEYFGKLVLAWLTYKRGNVVGRMDLRFFWLITTVFAAIYGKAIWEYVIEHLLSNYS